MKTSCSSSSSGLLSGEWRMPCGQGVCVPSRQRSENDSYSLVHLPRREDVRPRLKQVRETTTRPWRKRDGRGGEERDGTWCGNSDGEGTRHHFVFQTASLSRTSSEPLRNGNFVFCEVQRYCCTYSSYTRAQGQQAPRSTTLNHHARLYREEAGKAVGVSRTRHKTLPRLAIARTPRCHACLQRLCRFPEIPTPLA